MPQVAISSDFFTAFADIPKDQQKKVREFITRFQTNPRAPSIHYELLNAARDKRVRTVRIDQAYRAIVLAPDKGEVFVLVWVDHHDEAMDWARNKSFEVNPTTGALQIIDAVAVQAAANIAMTSAPVDKVYGPFETFAEQDLLRTGLPGALLPSVRALKSADGLDALKPFLPAEAYERLAWIGYFGYSVDQALNEVPAAPASERVDVSNFEAALEHPDSRRRFVVVKSAEELIEMLNAPLAKWRIFLHPSQAALVNRDFNGPARVLGGAGTGKTVVAMHRARHLARDVFTASTDRILFTTFSKTLAANMRANLASLCGPELERIEVIHLHSWASSFLRAQGITPHILNHNEVDTCWQNAFSAIGMGEWDDTFFRNEWERVVQNQNIQTQDEYLRASRAGQSVRLTRPQRAQVWEVLEEYKRQIQTLGKMEWVDLIRQTRMYLAQSGIRLPYRSVVVDETQDWNAEELKLIRQLVTVGPNDLFLVGDAHQRIYGRPVVLSQCGINIRGRSGKLRINYRTTEEIREWAVQLLCSQDIDDLDGGSDSLRGYTSLLSGAVPLIRQFKSLSEEQAFLVEHLKNALKDVPRESICVVARKARQIEEDYLPALINAGIPVLYLQADTPENASFGVRLATMHRVKGLEFAHILIAGVNEGIIPLERGSAINDEIERADFELQERCLLHVAATRARDTLVITSYGIPSKFIG